MTTQSQSLPFRFNFIKREDIAKSESIAYELALKPQLAYDPKIGEDYSLFFDYAKTHNSLAWESDHVFYAEPKMDGVRGQFVIEYNRETNSLNAYCLSRANRKLLSVNHLLSDLESNKALAEYLNKEEFNRLVIDTELTVFDKEENTYAEFRYINGLANRRLADFETIKLSAYIFQIYFVDSTGQCISTIDPFKFEHLIYAPHGLGLPENGHWHSAPRYQIASAERLASLGQRLKAHHWEGLVLKSSDYHHFNGRSKQWLKLKFRRSGTFKLLGVAFGEGKCAGTCGAIKVMDAVGQTTMVGTGMTDQDRDELASLATTCLTTPIYVQVSYMTKTGDSLREPVYEGIRYDLKGSTSVSLDIFSQR